jgi:Tfp pilus assembly protein PilF
MRGRMWMIALAIVLAGCASRPTSAERTLKAPANTVPAAAAAVEEGNRLFDGRQLEAAKLKYQEAIKAQPTLAEAHYNLALVYDVLRDDATAKHHYIEAANLAPGHKVIWDAPPLRRHGDVDAHPNGSAGPLFVPVVGGH